MNRISGSRSAIIGVKRPRFPLVPVATQRNQLIFKRLSRRTQIEPPTSGAAVKGKVVIPFNGTITSLSWTVPSPELYSMFIVGITDTAASPVPEPGTWAAAALLLGGAGFVRRRKRGKVS